VVRSRLYGILVGYEGQNDRATSAFKLVVGRLRSITA
jgi:hypothetical protein